VTFLLETPDGTRGIVAGMHDAAETGVVHLMAMWVNPAIRGTGAGDDLVAAIVAWAASEGARAVRLDVMQANEPARRCYERNGFRQTGHGVARESDGRIQVRMERLVTGPVRK
jgi:ribosomal protein S18 acetylase RimI-like enzyme